MSKTAVETSGDVNVKVASHLSKVPSRATDAFTKNLTVLSPGVIANTGACARLTDGSTADANRHRTANRMESLLKQHCDDQTLNTQAACHLGEPRPTVKSNRLFCGQIWTRLIRPGELR